MIEDNSILQIQEKFETIGCVMEICRFHSIDPTESEYELSRRAATSAMKKFKKRQEESWNRRNPNLKIEEYFHIQIDTTKEPKGKKVDFRTFLGDGYDLLNDEVDLFSYSESGKSNKHDLEGLSHAILNPPYSLRLNSINSIIELNEDLKEQEKLTALFKLFLQEVLSVSNADNNSHLVIYEWSTDWSNYFDAGHEWWGSFYWSILDKEANIITIIGASETD